jgi:hypothetical protein
VAKRPARGARRPPLQPAPPPVAHGYSPPATAPSSDVPSAPSSNHLSDLEARIHPELRARPATSIAPTANMMPATVAPQLAPTGAVAGPSIAMANPSLAVGGGGDETSTDGRKAKRELSQSKRAAQNRAAQVSSESSHLSNKLVNCTFPFGAGLTKCAELPVTPFGRRLRLGFGVVLSSKADRLPTVVPGGVYWPKLKKAHFKLIS